MKKITVLSVIVGMVVVAVLLYAENRQTKFSDCVLSNVEALTSGEEDEGSRPTVILGCYIVKTKNNKSYEEFSCFRIEKCENYKVVPPMVKDYCSASSCPNETYCKTKTYPIY